MFSVFSLVDDDAEGTASSKTSSPTTSFFIKTTNKVCPYFLKSSAKLKWWTPIGEVAWIKVSVMFLAEMGRIMHSDNLGGSDEFSRFWFSSGCSNKYLGVGSGNVNFIKLLIERKSGQFFERVMYSQ